MDSHYHTTYPDYCTLIPFDRWQESKMLDLDLILDSRCVVVISSCLLNIHYLLLKNETVRFCFHFWLCCFSFSFFYFNFYCYSITVVCLFSPSLRPPQLNPPPYPTSTLPLGFFHVSFIVVPVIPSSHYPPNPRLLLDCSFFFNLNIFIDYAITVVPFPPYSTPSCPPSSLPHSPPPIVHVHGSYL